jgi:hypothetical protein
MQGAGAEALVAPPQDRKQGVGRVLEGDNFMCKIHHCGRRCMQIEGWLPRKQNFLHFCISYWLVGRTSVMSHHLVSGCAMHALINKPSKHNYFVFDLCCVVLL